MCVKNKQKYQTIPVANRAVFLNTLLALSATLWKKDHLSVGFPRIVAQCIFQE